jgi:hypothetical protein
VAFGGIYLLAPRLTKLFRKTRLEIPRRSWMFFVLPIGTVTHLLIGKITPLTAQFIDPHGHYFVKILIVGLFGLGVKSVKIVRKKLR